MLSAALAKGNGRAALHFAMMIGAFMAGTVASGIIIQDSTLQLDRRYGVALLIEAVLLCAAAPLLARTNTAGTMACGLRNAMVSTYSGAVIRTTHLSGMFTDLGIFLGHSLRGIPVAPRRLQLCITVISGYLGGGICGAIGFEWLRYSVLYIPAGVTASAALGYGLFGRRQSRRSTERPQRLS